MKNEIIIIAAAGAALLLLNKNTDPTTGETDDTEGLGSMYYDLTQPDADPSNSNTAAFLTMIRIGEGTSGDRGYNELCGGSFTSDLSDHPANKGWKGLPLSTTMCAAAGFGPGCVSTAAGAYQFTRPTWNSLAKKLGLTDFSPASQDAACIEKIRLLGALDAVQSGDLQTAVDKCKSTWASFAGAGYGQNEVAYQTMVQNFTNAGGVTA